MNDNIALLELVHNGDKRAKDILVEENMGLVHSIVKRYINRGYEREDLVQIGAMGLVKAIDKFDLSFNVKFSTYAVPMIAGEIKRFIRDDGAIKISRRLKENALKGWRANEKLQKEYGREATVEEISKECQISVEDLIEAFEAATPPASMYESVCSDGDREINLLDTIKGEEIEDVIINKVMINNILSSMTARERQIIVLRYFKNKTQSEVANIIGVSQVQVSRIEKKAIDNMRKIYVNNA